MAHYNRHNATEDIRQQVALLATDARRKLGPWAAQLKALGGWVAESLGDIDGISLLLRVAKLDADGSGALSDKEWDNGLTEGSKLIEETMQTSINTGMVAVLIVTMVFPYLMEPPTFNKGQWEIVGDSIVGLHWALKALFLFSINIALVASLCAVGVASMITSQLIKMSCIENKLMWLVKNVQMLLNLTKFTWLSVYSIAVSAVAGALLNGPMNGGFSMITLIGMLYFIFGIQIPAWNYTRVSLHSEAKLLLIDAPGQIQLSTI